jgi:hypothetical protein
VSNKVSHQILFTDDWQPNFSCTMSPSSAIKCKKIGYVSRVLEHRLSYTTTKRLCSDGGCLILATDIL